MTNDNFWELFTNTGDPICWLLSRARDLHDNTNFTAAKCGTGNDAYHVPHSDSLISFQ